MITIIDYGAGNPGSVKKAFEYLGEECVITSSPAEIGKAERLVFPGVGSFGSAMKNIRKMKLEEPIKKSIKSGVPFLGICLGLQLLFEKSEESPDVRGLCVFNGKCVKFTNGKVPQIGWNTLDIKDSEMLGNGGFVYFVNSYYAVPDDKKITASTTQYGIGFTSAVRKGNITAFQFHPEKSGKYGLDILRRWLNAR